jgi:hypothetical protein
MTYVRTPLIYYTRGIILIQTGIGRWKNRGRESSLILSSLMVKYKKDINPCPTGANMDQSPAYKKIG